MRARGGGLQIYPINAGELFKILNKAVERTIRFSFQTEGNPKPEAGKALAWILQ